jgi:hypothetical protein
VGFCCPMAGGNPDAGLPETLRTMISGGPEPGFASPHPGEYPVLRRGLSRGNMDVRHIRQADLCRPRSNRLHAKKGNAPPDLVRTHRVGGVSPAPGLSGRRGRLISSPTNCFTAKAPAGVAKIARSRGERRIPKGTSWSGRVQKGAGAPLRDTLGVPGAMAVQEIRFGLLGGVACF